MKDKKYILPKGDKPNRCRKCGITIRKNNKSLLCNYCKESHGSPKIIVDKRKNE
jgi:predicted Zn-ribbon and HTH transcriptional regulator